MTMIASIVLLVVLVPSVSCVGGMAELKSITGDEPYTGQGPNAPMPIPRPMGFWGRPRYAPVGYGYGGTPYLGGVSPYLAGGSPYYGQGSRYSSISYSPYEEDGQLPFNGPVYSPGMDNTFDPVTLLGSLFNGPSYSPSASSSLSSPYRSPSRPSLSYENLPSSFATDSHPESSFAGSSPFNSPTGPSRPDLAPSSPGSSSLSSLNLGGFYKGRGNEMVNRH